MPESREGRRDPPAAGGRARWWIGCAAILVASFAVYAPALDGDFVFDDDIHVIENPVLEEGGLRRMWLTPPENFNYWPITWTSYWIEHRLWGLDPFGYHLVNVLIHAAGACLIWAVLRRLGVPYPWLVALVFALHPVNVASVAWISQRRNVLSLFFFALSLLLYLRFEQRRAAGSYLLALASYLAAMLSKGAAAPLPAVLLLCAWWRQGSLRRRDLRAVAPFFLVAALMSLIEISSQSLVTGSDVVREDDLAARTAGAGRVVWFYLSKAVLPLDLAFFYPRWQIDAADPLAWAPLLAFAALLAAAWLRRGSWGRPVLFALLYFVLMLSPVLGFFNIYFMRFSYVADHYQYLALVGIVALLVGGLGSLLARHVSRAARVGAAAVVVGLCAVGSAGAERHLSQRRGSLPQRPSEEPRRLPRPLQPRPSSPGRGSARGGRPPLPRGRTHPAGCADVPGTPALATASTRCYSPLLAMPDDRKRFESIDPDSLPKHFDAAAAEARWAEEWERSGVYRWDPSRPREETFVVDTPPPTVSGSLHVGHVFCYTHTDVLARYQRMRGRNVFYPMGWDDNGLPTERRVQNHFHVRCDPHAPHDPQLALEPATAKTEKEPPRLVSRAELHRALPSRDRGGREGLRAALAAGRALGRLDAALHDDRRPLPAHRAALVPRSLAEAARLQRRGAHHVGRRLPDRGGAGRDRGPPAPGAFHHIEFGVEGSGEALRDRDHAARAAGRLRRRDRAPRRRALQALSSAARAVTPLFRVPVPIFPSELVDPEKGTGILMVCTFGDATDVRWWREERLPLRQLVGRDGRLAPVEFGSEAFPSLDAAAANRAYAELAGKTVNQARTRSSSCCAIRRRAPRGRGAPLRGRARADRAHGQVLREGRAPARVRADAPVVRAPARQEGGAARQGRADRVAPGLHGHALPRLDREPAARLVHQPPALLRRADPGLVSARRRPAGPTTRTRSSPSAASCRSTR